jgi:hypothetical protein
MVRDTPAGRGYPRPRLQRPGRSPPGGHARRRAPKRPGRGTRLRRAARGRRAAGRGWRRRPLGPRSPSPPVRRRPRRVRRPHRSRPRQLLPRFDGGPRDPPQGEHGVDLQREVPAAGDGAVDARPRPPTAWGDQNDLPRRPAGLGRRGDPRMDALPAASSRSASFPASGEPWRSARPAARRTGPARLRRAGGAGFAGTSRNPITTTPPPPIGASTSRSLPDPGRCNARIKMAEPAVWLTSRARSPAPRRSSAAPPAGREARRRPTTRRPPRSARRTAAGARTGRGRQTTTR